jgi:hypothetical protein
VFEEGELQSDATVAFFAIVQTEGKTLYNNNNSVETITVNGSRLRVIEQ